MLNFFEFWHLLEAQSRDRYGGDHEKEAMLGQKQAMDDLMHGQHFGSGTPTQQEPTGPVKQGTGKDVNVGLKPSGRGDPLNKRMQPTASGENMRLADWIGQINDFLRWPNYQRQVLWHLQNNGIEVPDIEPGEQFYIGTREDAGRPNTVVIEDEKLLRQILHDISLRASREERKAGRQSYEDEGYRLRRGGKAIADVFEKPSGEKINPPKSTYLDKLGEIMSPDARLAEKIHDFVKQHPAEFSKPMPLAELMKKLQQMPAGGLGSAPSIPELGAAIAQINKVGGTLFNKQGDDWVVDVPTIQKTEKSDDEGMDIEGKFSSNRGYTEIISAIERLGSKLEEKLAQLGDAARRDPDIKKLAIRVARMVKEVDRMPLGAEAKHRAQNHWLPIAMNALGYKKKGAEPKAKNPFEGM